MNNNPITIDNSELFNSLIGKLNASSIPYCILGDYAPYPEVINSDIDFMVGSDHFKELYSVLKDVAESCGSKVVQALQHETTACYYVLAKFDENNIIFLHPDACSDYFRNGRLFLRAEDVLSGRVLALSRAGESKGFYVPAPSTAFIYYLIKKLDKGELHQHHGEYLSSLWLEDPEECRRLTSQFWKHEEADLIAKSAIQRDWTEVREALTKIQASLHSSIKFSFFHWWQETIRKINRVFFTTGLWVVFLGADGSGKSSVIQEVTKKLSPAFRRTSVFHLRPMVLTNSGTVHGPVTEPHALPVRSGFLSLIKLFYFLFDFIAGYFFKIRPALVRSTFVTFDRYYHDLLIDPKRYRYGGPMWLASVIGKLIPHPDLFILLDAPAETLQSRKQEVSSEESARQRRSYLNFIRSQPNGIIVDSSTELDQVVIICCEKILIFMARKVERRY